MPSDLQEEILLHLGRSGVLHTYDLASELKEDHNKVVGAVKSLQTFGDIITVTPETLQVWELTEEGREVVSRGSHEMEVFNLVPSEGILHSELMAKIPKRLGGTSVGFSKAMSAKWLKMDKQGTERFVRRNINDVKDSVQEHLCLILSNKSDCVSLNHKLEYKKRKLINEVAITSYQVKKGEAFTMKVPQVENDLTADMIATGSWKECFFKPYNYDAMGVPPACGHFHPLLKVRTQFRQIFLEMGFTEMPTNNYVESSFWNFDALFQPQEHPAREAHDTFFLSDPATSNQFPRDYMERVRKVHSEGGYGSQGYGSGWKEEEASKNLLRTHTTAVSARMLYKLAQEGFHPAKYFSIDRVFRNEELDATHLAEFHQVEGVVADYNLSLGHLIGILSEFFRKLGMDKLHFKPAYNPYTEPSMEIYSYHSGLEKWIEVGNSGIFRPEMLLPMGLPENVNVIAWGLSLERPTMIKYHLDNIRDLVGPKVDLQMVYDNPICLLDKGGTPLEKLAKVMEQRWDNILSKLQELKIEVESLKHESSQAGILLEDDKLQQIVIFASPKHPPYSLLVLLNILRNVCTLKMNVHVHSSATVEEAACLKSFNLEGLASTTGCDLINVTFVWKEMESGANPVLLVSPVSHLHVTGEVNVARYLARLIKAKSPSMNIYENGALESCHIDEWLDSIHQTFVTDKHRNLAAFFRRLNKHLETHEWLGYGDISIADMCLWSVFMQNATEDNVPSYVRKWYTRCCQHSYCESAVKS